MWEYIRVCIYVRLYKPSERVSTETKLSRPEHEHTVAIETDGHTWTETQPHFTRKSRHKQWRIIKCVCVCVCSWLHPETQISTVSSDSAAVNVSFLRPDVCVLWMKWVCVCESVSDHLTDSFSLRDSNTSLRESHLHCDIIRTDVYRSRPDRPAAHRNASANG